VIREAYIFPSHLKHKNAALPNIFHNIAPAIILKELLALFQVFSSWDIRCGTILCTVRSPPEKKNFFPILTIVVLISFWYKLHALVFCVWKLIFVNCRKNCTKMVVRVFCKLPQTYPFSSFWSISSSAPAAEIFDVLLKENKLCLRLSFCIFFRTQREACFAYLLVIFYIIISVQLMVWYFKLVRNKASHCSSIRTTNNALMMLCSPATKNSCSPDIAEMILAKSFLACWSEVNLLSKKHFRVLVGKSLMNTFAICRQFHS